MSANDTPLHAFVKLVETEMAGYTLGINLFMGYQPPKKPIRCTTILFNQGGGFEADLPDGFEFNPQFLHRAQDESTVIEDAWLFFEQYKRRIYVDLPIVVVGSEWTLQRLWAEDPPQREGTDELRRFEYTVDYIGRIKIKE